MIFEVLGGRKSMENGSGNSIQQELGFKSGLGGSWGRCLSHCGVNLGPKIAPESDPKTSRLLDRIWGGPKGEQLLVTRAPLGLRRAAGAGEG